MSSQSETVTTLSDQRDPNFISVPLWLPPIQVARWLVASATNGYLRRVMTRFTVIGKWLLLAFPEDLPVTAANRVIPSTGALFIRLPWKLIKYPKTDISHYLILVLM